MPSRINAISTLPRGYGVYEDTTFATSCAHNDPACYAKCTAMATACGSKWFQWTSRNSYLTFTKSPTSFSTTTITSQNYAYSTSVVQEGEARITFEYASPIGKPIATITSVHTLYSMDQIVTRWTEPPPTCTPSAWLQCTKGPDCRACTVQGGTVEVLFWPPASKNATSDQHGSMTGKFSNGSIAIRDSIKPPVTAMFGTHTLTSPSVYISFQTAYALNDCGQTVGKAMPGALLPMDAESLFTMRAGLDYFEVTSGSIQTTFYESASFNYNDFDGPVPPSAYTHQPSCLASGCYTIYPDYHPQLALPPQVRSMDPAWESCALDWRGAWDPPIALTGADAIVTPTKPVEGGYTEPASPKSTAGNPAMMTSAPAEISDPFQTSSSMVSNSDSSSTKSGGSDPLFTYLPISPSDGTEHEPGPTASQRPEKENTASSLIQVTTILQIDPHPVPSEIVVSSTASALESSDELSAGDGESDGQPTSTSTNPEASKGSHSIFSTAEQVVSKAPSGGLAIADTTITAGGDAITIESVVYSAASGDGLLIISDVPAALSTHSPTNAYEVLSEALGNAGGHQTYPFDGYWSEIMSPTTTPSNSQGISASDMSSTHTPSPEAILDLGSTTITASQHSSSILQVGDQYLGHDNPVITIGSHTLSTASNAIIIDGTTATFTQPSTTAQNPTVLTLGSSLLTAQAAASSGAIEIGSHTLVPGSSALVTAGHTLSAASSGLIQDGSLVVPRVNTSSFTSQQSLPSVQLEGGSEMLPSVTSEPTTTIDSGGGGVPTSNEEAGGSSNESNASRLRQIRGLAWFGGFVMLLAGAW